MKTLQLIRPRELMAVALSEQAKQFKLIYAEGSFTTRISYEALISIEPEIIWAINLGNYIPRTKNAEVLILNEKEEKTGILKLYLTDNVTLSDSTIYLYKVSSAKSYLLPYYSIVPDNLAYLMKRKLKYHLEEIVRLRKLFVYYINPKPSFFLSVKAPDRFDIFPIDLTGKISNDYFSVAVKGTNKAINLIKTARCLCVSALPFNNADIVYAHSEQRRRGNMNAKTLLFHVSESPNLKIPVPDFALQVNEFQVERIFEQGIYSVFILKSINRYILSDGLQLAHTPWYNKQFFSSVQPSRLH